MRKKYLIATTKMPPTQEKANELVNQLTKIAEEDFEIKLIASRGETGPGCYNIAFIVEGEEERCEIFAREITMALQPGRYCDCADADWEGHTWVVPS